jgi:DNA gyrase subunit B
MSSFTSELANSLQVWFKSNEKEVKIIADKALAARKAREAAKKARDAARGQQEKKKKALKFASKLADCNSSNRSECEIYITEGKKA